MLLIMTACRQLYEFTVELQHQYFHALSGLWCSVWVMHHYTVYAVESNTNSEHDLYLAYEDSTTFFLLLNFLLFSSCPLSFYCTLTSLLSLSQCRQLSATLSTRLRNEGSIALMRSAIIHLD